MSGTPAFPAMRCIRCDRELVSVTGNDRDYQPHDGVVCESHGNYGSTLHDPCFDSQVLVFVLCDPCLHAKRHDIGLIENGGKDIVRATKYLNEGYKEQPVPEFSARKHNPSVTTRDVLVSRLAHALGDDSFVHHVHKRTRRMNMSLLSKLSNRFTSGNEYDFEQAIRAVSSKKRNVRVVRDEANVHYLQSM